MFSFYMFLRFKTAKAVHLRISFQPLHRVCMTQVFRFAKNEINTLFLIALQYKVWFYLGSIPKCIANFFHN